MKTAKTVKNRAQLIWDIVEDRHSPAYREFSEVCWNNQTQQSDAMILVYEFKKVLIRFLQGDYSPVNEPLAQVGASAQLSVQPLDARRPAGLNVVTKQIRVGDRYAKLVITRPDSITAEQILYGLLADALSDGSIDRLAVCVTCGGLFYRESLKGETCSDRCRYKAHRETPKERHDRYVGDVRKTFPHAQVRRYRPRKNKPE